MYSMIPNYITPSYTKGQFEEDDFVFGKGYFALIDRGVGLMQLEISQDQHMSIKKILKKL